MRLILRLAFASLVLISTNIQAQFATTVYSWQLTGGQSQQAQGDFEQACRALIANLNELSPPPPNPDGTQPYWLYQTWQPGHPSCPTGTVAACEKTLGAFPSFAGCLIQQPSVPCPPNSTGTSTCTCNAGFTEANNTCSGGLDNGFCPNGLCTANPVNPANGNKVERQLIYQGLNGFELSLTYNSFDYSGQRFSRSWRDTFDRRITQKSTTTVVVFRADGKTIGFTLSGNQWVASSPAVNDRLSSTNGGWELKAADDDEVETYDGAGRLVKIRSRSGLSQTLIYSDGSTTLPNGGFVLDSNGTPTSTPLPKGRLIRAHDHFQRNLRFGYDAAGRVVQVTYEMSGSVFKFGYDSNNNLVTITRPDNAIRTYLYQDSAHPQALTGIIDENGGTTPYATFQYDAQKRVTVSEHALGNSQKHTFAYDQPTAGKTTVTDLWGAARIYTNLFDGPTKKFRNSGIESLSPCPECGSKSQTFDANGNVTFREDWNGNGTRYTYDTTRNLELTREEGLTSAGAWIPGTSRKITTVWDLNFRLPTAIYEPLKRTTFVVDANGSTCGAPGAICETSLRATTDTDGSVGASAALTSGVPERKWTFTYNGDGAVLTENGPLAVADVVGGTPDVTTYTLFQSASCCT
jgi:YD repeat-containing protein